MSSTTQGQNEPGLTRWRRRSAQDLSKLKAAGYATVLGVIQATRKTLTKIKVGLCWSAIRVGLGGSGGRVEARARGRGGVVRWIWRRRSRTGCYKQLTALLGRPQGLSEIKVDKIKVSRIGLRPWAALRSSLHADLAMLSKTRTPPTRCIFAELVVLSRS